MHQRKAPVRLLAAAGMAFSLLFVGACDDDDPTDVPVATSVAVESGNNQTIAVSTAAAPLMVTVLDQDDDEMQGVPVTWSITSGGGTLSATSSTTNADGNASVTYTSPGTTGAKIITATVAGLPAVTFTITVQ